ncbi:MAG: DNA methyltransferase [Chloroflexota bacterium]
MSDAELMTIREASMWAGEYLGKKVTPSNISYLIQYGRVPKRSAGGVTKVARAELLAYYRAHLESREGNWKAKLGADINRHLSFDHLKEADTTKHVHRLHPYKGKFIPQLVEYFIDGHTDEFKKQVYFQPGEVLLDPFCGSGTTLVQANESGLHAVGVDVSGFNALVSNIKVGKHALADIRREVEKVGEGLARTVSALNVPGFEERVGEALSRFNRAYFPSPEFKVKARKGEVDEDAYGEAKAREFLPEYEAFVREFGIQLRQAGDDSFLGKWYLQTVRDEIEFVRGLVNGIADAETRRVAQALLSRTVRSCRATTHADLATLVEPVSAPYYCAKHGKMCRPLFSILGWWERYSKDTLARLEEFEGLRTDTLQHCLTGDSRTVDLEARLAEESPALADLVRRKRIKGIFSSPPYVGLIDYHEQHAYAYELFGFHRQDDLEIGALFKGQGQQARDSYVEGIADALTNCRRFLADDFTVFLVANDKHNLYPLIAERAGMTIVETFRRPVLNRTERDKAAYSEKIFLMKER